MRSGILRAIAARASALGLLVSAVCAGGAAAQQMTDPAGTLPVRDRSRPGFDATGVRLGSFIFYPSITAAPFHDSNVFAAPRNPVADSGVLLSPRLSAVSQFSRHSLEVELGADSFRHRRHSSEDRTDAFARADGRLDIQRDTVALAHFEAALRHEDRGSPDSPALAAEPTPVKRLAGGATLNRTFNRFGLSLGTRIARADYEDIARVGGGTLDQDFRDHIIYSLGGRATYAWSPGQRVFADLRANWRRYSNQGATAFGSRGFTALAGVEFALTTLLHGELGVGYLRQEYDSAMLADVEGPSYLVSLIWNPTPLMTLTVTGERQVQDSIAAGASGRIESSFKAVLDYELLRNLIIAPRLRFAHLDYASIARVDTMIEPGVALEYMVNRYIAIGGEYVFTVRDSNAIGAGYDRHQASIHAKAQF